MAAIEWLRSLRMPLPADYPFDRDKANSRDGLSRSLGSDGKPDTESESNPDPRE
jgi:hypothetical protein